MTSVSEDEAELWTIPHLLKNQAVRRPNDLSCCSIDGNLVPQVQFTWKTLSEAAERIGRAVSGFPGERFLLPFAGPSPQFAASFFGTLLGGAIPVVVPPPMKSGNASRLMHCVGDCRPVGVLGEQQELDTMRSRLSEFPQSSIRHWFHYEGLVSGGEVETANDWELSNRDTCSSRRHGSSLAYLQYTSGSTSAQRGVRISHQNVISNLQFVSKKLGEDPEGCLVSWLPVFHDMGLGALLYAIYHGIPSVLISPRLFVKDPSIWIRAISSFRGSCTAAPCFGYEHVLNSPSNRYDATVRLDSWKVALCGAERIRPNVLSRFAERFQQYGFNSSSFCPAYGLAEGTFAASVVPGASAPEVVSLTRVASSSPECAGVTLAEPGNVGDRQDLGVSTEFVGCGQGDQNHQLTIIDPNSGRPLPDGQLGEIYVAGSSVAEGYWSNESEHQVVRGDGFSSTDDSLREFKTGDLGVLLRGQLFVFGRKKELIIIRGNNFSPEELENAAECQLLSNSTFRRCAVSVEEGEGEQLVLLQEISRRLLMDTSVELITRELSQSLAREFGITPTRVAFVKRGQLPTTSSGKLKRGECQAQYLAGKLEVLAERSATSIQEVVPESERIDTSEALDPIARRVSIERFLVRRLAEKLRCSHESIDLDLRFDRFGLDSLAAQSLLSDVQQFLEVDVSPVMVVEHPTVRTLSSSLADAWDQQARRKPTTGNDSQ